MCGFESDCFLGFRTLHLLKWSLAELAHGVKALTTKPDNLSLIPRTYMVEGEELTPESCPLAAVCFRICTFAVHNINEQ